MENDYSTYSTIESEDVETIYVIPAYEYIKNMQQMGWYVSTSGLSSGSWEIKYYSTT